jgi:N,N'-diacetyllegionaminate synthase
VTDSWLHHPRADAPCTIIAEVAQAHEGSLGMAHAFIDSIANCGADAVKFQTHIAAAESTAEEPWRTRFTNQDETRLDYWRRMEFTEAQWLELEAHAAERGLLFLSSPFSAEAVDLLERIGVAGWKVASGETSNHLLLDQMAATGRPIIVSTGMSTLHEIDQVVDRIKGHGVPLAVLQCTSAYPCPPELVGLNLIPAFRERYGCAVGLSDHSATIYPGLAAAAAGIDVLEVHLTLTREMFGPDVPASVTPEQLGQLVEGIRFIETMRAHPQDKEALAAPIQSLREIFTKSVVAASDLSAGTVLEAHHLTSKKPGSGIPANELPRLIGRRLARDVVLDHRLSDDDLEQGPR